MDHTLQVNKVIKYYQLMKKGKSQGQTLIHKYSFSVYPFSIFFWHKLSSKYTLYFEKSFQILGRFPTPYLQKTANQLLYFQNPEKVSSFRITTEKNFQYQWSLYSGNTAHHQEHQQHIETIKINLQEFWINFKNSKEVVKEIKIKFNKVKCQLSFLVAVGNQKDNLRSIQSTFRQAINEGEVESHLSSEKQQIKHSLLIGISQTKKNDEEKENQGGSNFHLNPPKQNFDGLSTPKKQGSQGQKGSIPLTGLNKTNSIILSIKKSEDSARLLESPQKNISLMSINDLSVIDSALYSQLKLQLTLSEVEIGRQIEQRVKAESDPLKLKSVDPHNQTSQVLFDSQHKAPSIEDAMLDKYRSTKMKRITQSQRLNHRGEIIVTPFYYHLKYYIIIFIIIAIFTGLIYLNPKSQFKQHIHSITYESNKRKQKSSRKIKNKKHGK